MKCITSIIFILLLNIYSCSTPPDEQPTKLKLFRKPGPAKLFIKELRKVETPLDGYAELNIHSTAPSATVSIVKRPVGHNQETRVLKKIFNYKNFKDWRVRSVLIANEILVMSHVKHPNLLSARDVFIDVDNHICIVMDHLIGLDMVDHIQKFSVISEEKAAKLSCEILSALLYLHSLGFAHLDVKPENIIFDYITERHYLIDYGLVGQMGFVYPPRGSWSYVSPEMIRSEPVSPSMDIWSLGSALIAMLENRSFFPDNAPMSSVLKDIEDGKCKLSKVKIYSDEIQDFMAILLDPIRRNRPSAAHLLEHPFIRQFC